jgi:hypothetical protein
LYRKADRAGVLLLSTGKNGAKESRGRMWTLLLAAEGQ